jgi:hypothetical protein
VVADINVSPIVGKIQRIKDPKAQGTFYPIKL